MTRKVNLSRPVRSVINVPGDKSLTHRALILSSLAEGVSVIHFPLKSADTLSTLCALRQLGVRIEEQEDKVIVYGVGLQGLQASTKALDLENSGTSLRLLAGVLAGQQFDSVLTGDASLQNRPHARVVLPLQKMGANLALTAVGTLPLRVYGGAQLQDTHYVMPLASAQVKSCLLLAGLVQGVSVSLDESVGVSRDHTENMLAYYGAGIQKNTSGCLLQTSQTLHARELIIPGDFSTAAFFIVLATLVKSASICIKSVGVNPTRTGLIDLLKLMGANISITNLSETIPGEPVADISVVSANLQAIEVPVESISAAIDEFPIFFVAAACAQGTTVLKAAGELRHKESDRIRSMTRALSTLGVDIVEQEDGVSISGGPIQGGEVYSEGDHRIAMALTIAAGVANTDVSIQDSDCVTVSCPNFYELASKLGMQIEEV